MYFHGYSVEFIASVFQSFYFFMSARLIIYECVFIPKSILWL